MTVNKVVNKKIKPLRFGAGVWPASGTSNTNKSIRCMCIKESRFFLLKFQASQAEGLANPLLKGLYNAILYECDKPLQAVLCFSDNTSGSVQCPPI